MTIHIKRKIVPIKKNTPPEGWTEEAKAGAKQAAAIRPRAQRFQTTAAT